MYTKFWIQCEDCIVGRSNYSIRVGEKVVKGVVGRFEETGVNKSDERLLGFCVEEEIGIGYTIYFKEIFMDETIKWESGGQHFD